MSRLGMREGFEMKGDLVEFDRSKLAALLKRVDPVQIAADAVRYVVDTEGLLVPEATIAAVLVEVEQGLAVADEDIR